ncbi:integrase, catalytic region, zinc finger, CCHC-type containing protein [Tanacetum coccineum]
MFASVARIETIRIVHGIRRSQECKGLPNGCKTTFLNGVLKEEVDVSKPEGFVDQEHPNYVFRLKKALYGLKQAPQIQNGSCEAVEIPMVERFELDKDPQGTPTNPTRYISMVGSFMYLTTSRPDLVFAICMCARYQEKPTEKHLTAIKQPMQMEISEVARTLEKEQMENGTVELYFVKKTYQLADIFMKALERERFKFLINHLGL